MVVAETWEAERHVCGMEDVFFSVMEDEGLWSGSLFGSRLRRVIYDLHFSRYCIPTPAFGKPQALLYRQIWCSSKRSINYSDADAARPVSLATPVNLPTRHSAYANPKVCVIRAASTLVRTWVGKSWFWGQGSWL